MTMLKEINNMDELIEDLYNNEKINESVMTKLYNNLVDIRKESSCIKEIEYLMDKANAEHGTKKAYCLFCNSTKYDGKVGIVHHKKCIIQRLRNII